MNTFDIKKIDVHFNKDLQKFVIYCEHADGSEDTLCNCKEAIFQPEAMEQMKKQLDEEVAEINLDDEEDDHEDMELDDNEDKGQDD